jgi:hypothetical protein
MKGWSYWVLKSRLFYLLDIYIGRSLSKKDLRAIIVLRDVILHLPIRDASCQALFLASFSIFLSTTSLSFRSSLSLLKHGD